MPERKRWAVCWCRGGTARHRTAPANIHPMPLGTHQTGGRQRVPSRPRPRGSSIGRQTARIEPIISKAGRPSHDPRESRLIESRFEGLLARSTQPLHVSYHRQHPIMTSPTLHRLLLLPFLGSLEISCQTTVEEEYADFNPIIRSQSESQESKVMRMFGEYDLEKKSEFQGRAYEFEGREANLRKSVKKEAYSFGDHPYFKFRKKPPSRTKMFFARSPPGRARWRPAGKMKRIPGSNAFFPAKRLGSMARSCPERASPAPKHHDRSVRAATMRNETIQSRSLTTLSRIKRFPGKAFARS